MKLLLFVALTAFLVQASAWPPLKNPSSTEIPIGDPPLEQETTPPTTTQPTPETPPSTTSRQTPETPPTTTTPPTPNTPPSTTSRPTPETPPTTTPRPVPISQPPLPPQLPASCDVPSCSGLKIYLQPTHEPTQFFKCTLFGRFVVASCPIGLVFNYSQQTCVLPSSWQNHC